MQGLSGDHLLRISEIAHQAGVSLTTVKFYAREGLIEPACKTSPNMAYYAPDCVERVRLIKALQSEKFYPLAVIKRTLQSGAAGEAELLETINKAGQADYYESLPFSAAVREAGLRPQQAELLVQAGLLAPTVKGRLRTCCKGDLRMMQLAKQRLDAGIPLAQTAQTFAMYDAHLREATRLDIESLITAGMLTHPMDTDEIVRMITVSDETLDDFIAGKRYAYNAALGADYLAQIEGVFEKLSRFGRSLCAILNRDGYGAVHRRLRGALSGTPADEVLTCYAALMHLADSPIAAALAAFSRADHLLGSLPAPTGDAALDTVRGALALSWQSFAPGEFGYDAQAARQSFLAAAPDQVLAELALGIL